MTNEGAVVEHAFGMSPEPALLPLARSGFAQTARAAGAVIARVFEVAYGQLVCRRVARTPLKRVLRKTVS